MNPVLFCLGFGIFFLSFFGYAAFFSEKLKINPAFTPILSVSVQLLTVYLLGFFSLKVASTAVYAVGIFLFARTLFLALKGKYSVKEFLFSPSTVFFLVASVFFVLRMKGISLLHVDNFSHWATIVKDMCLTDAYPRLSGAVTFRNYTPGSAVFIYHVCRTIGFTESHALMAQGVMISACFATLFCRASFRRPAELIAIVGVFFSVILSFELAGASLGIYSLLVDGLIAYFAMAGGIAVYAYRKDLFRCAALMLPIISALSLIKSSARIFALLIIIMATALLARKYLKNKWDKKKLLILPAISASGIGLAIILPAFWNAYTSREFEGYQNKFPSGVGGLIDSLKSKDADFLRDIASKMLRELTDLSSVGAKLLVFALVACAVTTVISIVFKGKTKFILGTLITSVCVGVFYILELFVLYGFIFPVDEAVILASFYRYYATLYMMLSAVLLTASVYTLSRMQLSLPYGRIVSSALALVMVTASLLTVKDNLSPIVDPYGREDLADIKVRREYFTDFYSSVSDVVPPNSYLIVFTEKTDFFHSSLPQYELMTSHCMFLYPYMLGNDELVTSRIGYPEFFIVESGFDTFKSLMESRGYVIDGYGTVYSVDRDSMVLTAK